MATTVDDFIICEGGLVQNDPALPVFDLDALDDSDVDEITNLYERLVSFVLDTYEVPITISKLPSSLRDALQRVEATVSDFAKVNSEIMAISRADDDLRAELIEYANSDTYGSLVSQRLAALVLGAIGIEVPQGKSVILTDCEPEVDINHLQINSSQLTYAVEQYNLSTGEALDADAIEFSIDWV